MLQPSVPAPQSAAANPPTLSGLHQDLAEPPEVLQRNDQLDQPLPADPPVSHILLQCLDTVQSRLIINTAKSHSHLTAPVSEIGQLRIWRVPPKRSSMRRYGSAAHWMPTEYSAAGLFSPSLHSGFAVAMAQRTTRAVAFTSSSWKPHTTSLKTAGAPSRCVV